MAESRAGSGLGAPPPLDQGVAIERQPAARVNHRHRPVHPNAGGGRALVTDQRSRGHMIHTSLTSGSCEADLVPLYSESSLRSWWKVTRRQNTLMMIQSALDT